MKTLFTGGGAVLSKTQPTLSGRRTRSKVSRPSWGHAHRPPGGNSIPLATPGPPGAGVARCVACERMRHATPEALERISGLLAQLREVTGLVERRPGWFSWRSRAFLHFHEEGTATFADVRLEPAGDFVRFPVTTAKERAAFLRRVRRAVGER
jgi:hypothetical protein